MKPIPEQVQKYRSAIRLLAPFLDIAVNHECIGEENIPATGRLIMVGNHRSDLDPLIITSHVPRFIVWVAAHYTFKIPLVGSYLAELGTIPISANKQDQINAFKQISNVMKNERILGIFPEGHDYMLENDFSRPMVKFHSGFARFAIKFQAPVLPTAIIGIEERPEAIPVPKFVRELLGFPKETLEVKNRLVYKRVRVVFGKPISLADFPQGETEKCVTELTKMTQAKINELIRDYAPVERRSAEGGRRSGTRIVPEGV